MLDKWINQNTRATRLFVSAIPMIIVHIVIIIGLFDFDLHPLLYSLIVHEIP